MTLSDAVTAAVAVLRRRPDDLLPWYFLRAAIPAIVRVVPFLAFVVGYVYLRTSGRLETAADDLGELDSEPPDPETEPEAFEQWVDEFAAVVEQVLTPEIVALAAVAFVVAVLIAICCYAVVAAGQLTACSARLRDNRGLTAGMTGARRYWLRFLGLYVLEFLAWIAVLLLAGALAMVVGGAALVPGVGPFGLVGMLLVIVIGGLALVAVRAVFAFAAVAVVVDDTTVFGAVSNTLSFIRTEPISAGFYYAISVGTIVAVGIVSSVLMLVDVLVFTSLVSAVVVTPALDLLKTALYNDYRARLEPPTAPERTLREQFRDGIGRGLSETIAFVKATPVIHAAVVLLALGSFAAGWLAAEPFAGSFETSISARLEGHIPPAAALEFFGNNWLVAITTAVSGVAVAIPAVASLLFNGVVMGVTARTEVELAELVAFVLPHGLFEIPAILVATALGIWLGRVGWRAYRGRTTREAVADALERSFWVIIGLGVLLAVAAVIEGFVSPYYYELFL